MGKAQAWYLDVVMAVFIFTAGVIAYQYYSLNIGNDDKERMKEMSFQADALSTELLKEGFPKGWNASNVVKIGIAGNNHHLDAWQWVEFSKLNYNLSKELLGMTYDFLVFLEDGQGNVTPINGTCGIGTPEAGFVLESEQSCSQPALPVVDDLIARERYLFAQGGIMKMKVYVFS